MQTFAQKKIAVAVGTALMAMAGGVYAAAGDLPAKRANAPIMVSNAAVTLEADAIALHTTAGVARALTLTLNFAPTVTAGTVLKMKGNAAPIFADATPANNDIYIHTLAGTTKTTFPTGQITYGGGWTNAGAVTQTPVYTLAPGAAGKFRIAVGGKLQYSVTGAVADFQDINVDLNKTATFFCADASFDATVCDGGTGTAAAAGVADDGAIAAAVLANTVSLHSSVVPAPVVATRAKPSAPTLVDGVNFTTTYPLAAAPAAANIVLTSIADRGDVTQSAVIADTGLTIQAAAANTTLNDATKAAGATAGNPLYEVFFTDGSLIDWTSGGAAADAAAYNSKAFHTGVTTATIGFSFATEGTALPYFASTVFKADGTAAALGVGAAVRADGVVPMPGTIIDGVSPVIVSGGITFETPSTATPSLTKVGIKFSEPMIPMGGGASTAISNLREVLENVSVGSNTLAALSLNSGVTPTGPDITTVDGQSTVAVSNVATDDVATVAAGIYTGKSMSVSRGITYQEINDTNYTSNLAAGTTLDTVGGTGANGEELAGGVRSATGVVEAIPATPVSIVAVAPPPSVKWGTDTSALASSSSADNTHLIDIITVTFAAGKGVKLAPAGTVFGTAAPLAVAKTAADLAANLVVDVFGSNGIRFQVRPVSATLDAENTMTVKVPTALIYSKLTAAGTQVNSVWIGYNADGTNNTNNTLVATDASSTLLSPVIVAKGLTSATNGPWVEADKDKAGAEPVDLPLVFTADPTNNQSTLLTQDVQGNIAGATAGSIVKAYLAYWADAPTTTATATIMSGKITNPGDKVATDLAIEFANSAALTALIEAQLQKVAPASPTKPGIANATPAGVASPFPVYVKLVRSNDPVAGGATNGSQNYLNARAVLGTTFASVASSTPRGSNPTNDETDPVYEVMLNPNTGAITGRLTGNIVIKAGTSVAATANRGLRFLDGKAVVTATPTVIGSSVVAQKSATGLALPGTANINLLMGIDPASNDLSALTSKNPFVLLVLKDKTGKYTQLTSANPLAANYMPFAPDVLNKPTTGVAKRAPVLLSVTDVKALPLPASSNWALYGFGNRALAAKPAVSVSAVNAFPRDFVGLETVDGKPMSFWTNDGATFADMALSMAGSQVGVATDLTTTAATAGSTLSTIGTANMVKGAQGLAWSNQDGAANGATGTLGHLYVAQATGVFAPATAAPAPALAAGWSLVNVPGVVGTPVAALGTVVDAVIKVGAQVGVTGGTLKKAGTGAGLGKGQFTWLAEDGAMPALTAGEAVFVHAKAKGSL